MRDIRIPCFAIAAQLEPEVLSAVLTKLSFMYADTPGDIVLHATRRQPPGSGSMAGWLEWTAYFYEDDTDPSDPRVEFTLGIIQRAVGAELEYHS